MKPGDLVKVKDHAMARMKHVIYWSPGGWHASKREASLSHIGLVLDKMQMEDGFFVFEVQFQHGIEWLDDIDLEKLEDESR